MSIDTQTPRASVNYLKLALLMIGCLLISACVQPRPQPPAADVGPVEPTDGQTVSLKVDQTLLLKFGENPSTGFLWQAPGYDKQILQLVSQPYIGDPQDDDEVGVGGTRYFQFKALKSGQTNIKMVNQRSTTPPDILKELQITIKVE